MTTTSIKDELNKLLDNLPPERQREVLDFAAFVADRHQRGSEVGPKEPSKRIHFDSWAGCLKHVTKDAVQLQHEVMEDWADLAEGKINDVSGGQ